MMTMKTSGENWSQIMTDRNNGVKLRHEQVVRNSLKLWKWSQMVTTDNKLWQMGENGNKGDKTSRDKWHVDAIQIETDAVKIC